MNAQGAGGADSSDGLAGSAGAAGWPGWAGSARPASDGAGREVPGVAGPASGATATEPGRPAGRLRGRVDLPAYLLATLAFAMYAAFSLYQWRHFAVPSWDLGIFTELAQRYANIQTPVVDIKGPEYNLLGDHFHPLLVLLGPLFRLWPSGLALLVLQDFLFALSSVPVVRFARRRIGSWQGIVLGVAYLLSFAISEAVKAQFHEIAFAVPLMAYGLVAWAEGRRRTGIVLIGLLVFVKEDLGLTVLMFGLVELWIVWGERSGRAGSRLARSGRDAARVLPFGDSPQTGESSRLGTVPKRENPPDEGQDDATGTEPPGPFPARTLESLVATFRSHAATVPLSLILWGTAWFVLAIFVLLPALNPGGGWDYTENIGSDNQTTATGFLAFLTNLFGPGRKEVILLLLALTAGGVGLRSPYMWLMAPTLSWRFIGDKSTYWDWTWHYNAILLPIAAVALVDGVQRLRAWPRLRDSWKRALASVAVLVSLATSLGMMRDGPFGVYLRGDGTAYEIPGTEISPAEGAIDAVGKTRNVVTDLRLLAYLVPHNRVYWEGSIGDASVDTVAATPASTVMTDGVEAQEWAENRFGGTWETVYDVDGYVVVKRVS